MISGFKEISYIAYYEQKGEPKLYKGWSDDDDDDDYYCYFLN